MSLDQLSFPLIPSEPSQPSRLSDRATGGTAFADLYSEAMQAVNLDMSEMLSAEYPDSSSAGSGDDLMSFLELQASVSPFGVCGSSIEGGEDSSAIRGELMSQVAAIRSRRGQAAATVSADRESPASSAGRATVNPISQAAPQTEGTFSSGIHRLISWIDSHAHLHSTHHCAASVRQAMEAAGIETADRPSSGDAGDYGPFLLRHGAQVISTESYEPKAGDIAVFDRTGDHPSGHIQVFDGQQWVSDFVQHTFSPYRDQQSTPPVTVYRLS